MREGKIVGREGYNVNVCLAMNVQNVAVDTIAAIPVFQKIAHCIDSTVPKMSSKQVAHYLISKRKRTIIGPSMRGKQEASFIRQAIFPLINGPKIG